MNSDTKKKIEGAARDQTEKEVKGWGPIFYNNDSLQWRRGYEAGAALGYSLALKDAEVLVKALEFECGNKCAHQNPCNAKEVLDQWRKVTEDK